MEMEREDGGKGKETRHYFSPPNCHVAAEAETGGGKKGKKKNYHAHFSFPPAHMHSLPTTNIPPHPAVVGELKYFSFVFPLCRHDIESRILTTLEF